MIKALSYGGALPAFVVSQLGWHCIGWIGEEAGLAVLAVHLECMLASDRRPELFHESIREGLV
jgi:hypothetical protein